MNFKLGHGIESSELNRSKKTQLAVAAVVLIMAVGAGGYLLAKKTSSPKTDGLAGTIEVRRDACKLFTLSDAKKVIGSKTEASKSNANAVSDKATVSTCSYVANAAEVRDVKAITILARSSNKIQARQSFELGRNDKAQIIKDLGDSAYYAPDSNQLNILKGESWIIIAATIGAEKNNTVELPQQIAKVVLSKL